MPLFRHLALPPSFRRSYVKCCARQFIPVDDASSLDRYHLSSWMASGWCRLERMSAAAPYQTRLMHRDILREFIDKSHNGWQVALDNGWVPIDDRTQRALSSARDTGEAQIELRLKGFKYRFDLVNLTQTNLQSQRTRPIRFEGTDPSLVVERQTLPQQLPGASQSPSPVSPTPQPSPGGAPLTSSPPNVRPSLRHCTSSSVVDLMTTPHVVHAGDLREEVLDSSFSFEYTLFDPLDGQFFDDGDQSKPPEMKDRNRIRKVRDMLAEAFEIERLKAANSPKARSSPPS